MNIQENLQSLYQDIGAIARQYDRNPGTVQLVAVSKKQPEARIQGALNAGHRLFGENRVQEAQEHWAHRKERYPDLTLHLIGPLQTNKVKDAVALFDVIETLDREKLAKALANEMVKQERHIPCFIQVNTGEEAQKAGVAPHTLSDFVHFCKEECALDIQGLMCIPPIDEPPALHFALLAKHREALKLPYLSMGMSADYQKAIPLGATHIRVGTGVFGARDTNN